MCRLAGRLGSVFDVLVRTSYSNGDAFMKNKIPLSVSRQIKKVLIQTPCSTSRAEHDWVLCFSEEGEEVVPLVCNKCKMRVNIVIHTEI